MHVALFADVGQSIRSAGSYLITKVANDYNSF